MTILFWPLATEAASQVGGRLSDRFHPRLPAALGAALTLAGVVLLLPRDSRRTMADVAFRFALSGLGFGFFISPSTVAVVAATSGEHVGVGGALVNTARFLGFAFGPTLATVFWNPALAGAAAVTAMRIVTAVVCGVQVLTIASVLADGVNEEGRASRAGDEASSPAA